MVGAVEIAARLFQAAFQVAEVSPAVKALSPALLGTIARRLITGGESVHIIDVVDGAVQLTEASSWSVVTGGPRPGDVEISGDDGRPEHDRNAHGAE